MVAHIYIYFYLQLAQTASVEKDDAVIIDLQEPVTLTFSSHYLNMFIKATPLSSQVGNLKLLFIQLPLIPYILILHPKLTH